MLLLVHCLYYASWVSGLAPSLSLFSYVIDIRLRYKVVMSSCKIVNKKWPLNITLKTETPPSCVYARLKTLANPPPRAKNSVRVIHTSHDSLRPSGRWRSFSYHTQMQKHSNIFGTDSHIFFICVHQYGNCCIKIELKQHYVCSFSIFILGRFEKLVYDNWRFRFQE